jgi:hypothetical protein
MSIGYTTFDPKPEMPNGRAFSIPTQNKVAKRALPGANAPYKSDNVRTILIEHPSFGPKGAYIKTGDKRGRDLHGGGSSLLNPYAERQGWRPTMGCTRGQNEDIKALSQKIEEFKRLFPNVRIRYMRY